MYELTIREARARANLAQWSKLVAECRQSGLTVSQWCSEHSINVRTFYSWQKKVFANVVEQAEPRFAELPKPAAPGTGVVATVHIGTVSVDLYSGASPEFAAALCKAISHAE